MAQLITFENPNLFFDYNTQLLDEHYFQYYHINTLFEELRQGEGSLFDVFNIIDEDSTFIIGVWANDSFYVYGNKWNESAIEILSLKLNIDEYDILTLRGSKELVNEIVKYKDLQTEIVNHRIIYEYEENQDVIDPNFVIGELDRYNDYFRLNIEYYTEDFNGQGQLSNDQISKSVLAGIMDGQIFGYSYQDKIVSTVRIINNHTDYKMIGSLYTCEHFRKKGFATKLLRQLSKTCLQNNAKKCGLLTEKTNISSNLAVQKAGYHQIDEWLNLKIICN